ncbi:MAG TPA: TonB-dependent receptor plug domain-containing protein [Dyella sp.]|uniref:TonB-dependent receptor n=1 Tax=Dyella sp. TaxID=1869338 RepID=UPI002D783350|nr:TonB-dependent receptor plug domain-containing protein [Dyella sp.]HET6554684.1 TonB-dependent receptor plug domain-containing protein [Dyella sp.]
MSGNHGLGSRARALGWAALCASMGMAGAVQAEQAGDKSSDTLEEVIVTANRVEQDVQKVAAAVQVVQGEALSEQAQTNIGAIFADTPSVNITAQPAGFSINIRGQMGDGPSGNQQGAVASEFDGIYNITSLATEVGFFDLDRMEVLPGPQSTQYGPNADGGVVNAISRNPTFGNWSGNGTLTYGNYNLRRGEFGQNIPLGGTFALRLSGAFIDRGSYTEPETSNQIAQSVRLKALWQPNEEFSIKAWVQLDHMGGTGNGLEPYIFSVTDNYNNDDINKPSIACNAAYFAQYPGTDCANPWNHPNTFANGAAETGHANLYETTYAATMSWQMTDEAILDVTPSYIVGAGTQTGNIPNGPPFLAPGTPAYNGTYTYTLQYPFDPFHEFATEVRIHNAPGARMLWAAGYYLWQYHVNQWGAPQGPPWAVGPEYGHFNATTTNALFGDITYPVSDSFRVLGGLRSSGDKRIAHQNVGPGNVSVGTEHYSHLDYRIGEELDLGPNAMEYFTYATGYRPGALNYTANTSTWSAAANEVNNAFELGQKSRFFDGRLQVNADAFYYYEANYQNGDNYTQFLPQGYQGITTTTGSPNICYVNGPGAQAPAVCNLPAWEPNVRAYGAETQVRFNATPDDRFSLSATFEKATYQKNASGCATVGSTLPASACAYGYNVDNGFSQSGVQFVDIQGATTAHTPEWAGNLGYNHIFHLGSYALDLGGTAFYSDSYFAHPADIPPAPDYQPAYWLFNATANLKPASEIWSLNAYVRNIRNYAVKESYLPSTTLGDPRLFGVTLNFKW